MVIRGTSRTAMGGAVARSADASRLHADRPARGRVLLGRRVGHDRSLRVRRDEPAAEVFLPPTPTCRCASGATLSRDGRRMVAGSSIPGPARVRIIDVATRERPGAAMALNFGSFSPDNQRFPRASDGMRLALYDGRRARRWAASPRARRARTPTGPQRLSAVYSRSRATIPSPSARPADGLRPDGDELERQAPSALAHARRVDGREQLLPSYSPDGRWVLFNRATASSNNAPDAALWAVRADGSGQPIALTNANGRDATWNNSWPKWTPFVERYVGELETLLWITFSSTRDYGLRLRQGSQRRAQLWMAAFRPRTLAMDPTSPAFWLPFQNIDDSNHIPRWVGSSAAWTARWTATAPRTGTCVNGRCAGARRDPRAAGAPSTLGLGLPPPTPSPTKLAPPPHPTPPKPPRRATW